MSESKYTQELKNNSMYHLEICKALEDLRVGNKNDIKKSQVEAFLGVNGTISDINKHLFNFSALLIPIIFSFTTITNLSELLDSEAIVFVKMSLVFLLSSLMAGFLHMFFEYRFFKKWQSDEEKKLRKWASTSFWPGLPVPDKIEEYISEYNSIKKETDDISHDMKSESSVVPLCYQASLWFIGISFLVFAILKSI